MVFDRPATRPSAHDRSADDQRQTGYRCEPHLLGHQQGGRGHDQLQTVLWRALAIEKQDILGAGADVDGEDLHGCLLYVSRFPSYASARGVIMRACPSA